MTEAPYCFLVCINRESSVQYFYNTKKRGVAHLWDDTDTFCNYLAILPQGEMQITTNKNNRRICTACHKSWVGWMTGTRKQPYNTHITTL